MRSSFIIRTGITARIIQLAWLVTLGSLCLFILVSTTEQERDLQESLSSKGQSVAVALGGEVASAAVSEDYTAVVEKAMEVVNGDNSVSFILITKSDGYAMLVQRSGWQILPAIDASWYNGPRTVSGAISTVSLVRQRVFHYRHPLDCLGIPWGWIHVGLSLDTYDRSTERIYLRSLLLGLICMLFGLLASVLFARRLVRPIQKFRTTVEQLAEGDLSARVDLNAHDEIRQLGEAFNAMADAIAQRDRIVESVRTAAQTLQITDDWEMVIYAVIEQFAQAAQASRVLLVQMKNTPQGQPSPEIFQDWATADIPRLRNSPELHANTSEQLTRACQLLMQGEMIAEKRCTLETLHFWGPAPQPIARMAAPIFVGNQFWGALILHDCMREREWKAVERHAIRTLADMFGSAIQRQIGRQALLAAKAELEQRVEERTAELRMQITAKDQANLELHQAQSRLIELSRMSGMAEVATGVLHNVGNVLNSINVGASLIVDRLDGMKLGRLHEVSEMMQKQSLKVGDFLTNDPRGQRIIPYLLKLSEQLASERQSITIEAESLVKHVAHVKEIVSMQQGYARNCGVIEKVSAEELIENAINISAPALERHAVEIIRVFEPLPKLRTDRHKVLQILLNLLQNAKDATKASDRRPRRIWLRLKKSGDDHVQFEVEDNGIGIEPEHLVRIFSHGFTTKKSGHGFGLHSGALAARELGGTLRVASNGPGHGATFTLELPMQSASLTEAGGSYEQAV